MCNMCCAICALTFSPPFFSYYEVPLHVCVCVRTSMCKSIYVCMYVCMYIHACIQTYIHTYIHTYMHAYVCVRTSMCKSDENLHHSDYETHYHTTLHLQYLHECRRWDVPALSAEEQVLGVWGRQTSHLLLWILTLKKQEKFFSFFSFVRVYRGRWFWLTRGREGERQRKYRGGDRERAIEYRGGEREL
jgi:hypothetical protein